MMGSITPLGERGRGRRWGPTVGAYLVGSALGGAAAGAAAGFVGGLLQAAAPAGVCSGSPGRPRWPARPSTPG